MNTKRLGTGHYRLTGITTLDGKTVEIVVNVWRHECGGWLSETVIDGRVTGSLNHHETKRDASIAAEQCSSSGYEMVAGLGICAA